MLLLDMLHLIQTYITHMRSHGHNFADAAMGIQYRVPTYRLAYRCIAHIALNEIMVMETEAVSKTIRDFAPSRPLCSLPTPQTEAKALHCVCVCVCGCGCV